MSFVKCSALVLPVDLRLKNFLSFPKKAQTWVIAIQNLVEFFFKTGLINFEVV